MMRAIAIIAITLSSCSANVELWQSKDQSEALQNLQQRLNALEGWAADRIRKEQAQQQAAPEGQP